MRYDYDNGRTMMEMIGVLSVVGLISVGGLTILTRAKSSYEFNQIASHAGELAASASNLSCQYDAAYGSYTRFLYKSEAFPKALSYDGTQDKYTGVNDVVYKITSTTESGSAFFNLEMSNLSDDACLQLACIDWGKGQNNRLISITINSDTITTDSDDYPLSMGTASESCLEAGNNTIKLKYRACR